MQVVARRRPLAEKFPPEVILRFPGKRQCHVCVTSHSKKFDIPFHRHSKMREQEVRNLQPLGEQMIRELDGGTLFCNVRQPQGLDPVQVLELVGIPSRRYYLHALLQRICSNNDDSYHLSKRSITALIIYWKIDAWKETCARRFGLQRPWTNTNQHGTMFESQYCT